MLIQRLSSGSGILCVAMSVLACSPDADEGTEGGDDAGIVEGSWCGKAVETDEQCGGDETFYAKLEQSESSVTGEFCEAYDHDCSPIQDGKVEGNTLTFSYSFESETVSGTFTLDGDTLVGSLFSTKCDCSIPKTLYRL